MEHEDSASDTSSEHLHLFTEVSNWRQELETAISKSQEQVPAHLQVSTQITALIAFNNCLILIFLLPREPSDSIVQPTKSEVSQEQLCLSPWTKMKNQTPTELCLQPLWPAVTLKPGPGSKNSRLPAEPSEPIKEPSVLIPETLSELT